MIIGLRPSWLSRPDMAASYAVSVRRARGLLTASFRFHFAVDTLAVRLTVPIIRVRKGLPPSSLPPNHHSSAGCIRMLRIMPGIPRKSPDHPQLAAQKTVAPDSSVTRLTVLVKAVVLLTLYLHHACTSYKKILQLYSHYCPTIK